ncbi:class I adenylate-forming enzyme family protein [Asaia krungthepensis]|uniref:Long-chain-fatty-acid--CoA ligase n=1 Tax=Asaia krungthepensis NRIC 0535 TaxID=1307925 RepID=A0ABQ0Q6N4_9PROT|nr:class I adenylate-forming enzyme family protein [Asaia krungthepensis]GBQ93813.1 long-chain-fatty-acid--CoA ligase [Asaia krungthepensis NRIC 0535]
MFHVMALRHAKQNPHSLAFDSLAQDWTFGQLERDVRAVTQALRKLEEADPRLVGIHCGNLYWHWVLVLSLASLGLASASLPESSDPSFLRDVQLLEPDIIISIGGLSLQDVQVLEINEAWLSRVRQIEARPVNLANNPDAVCRYAIAAGTDIERKVLAMTFRQAEMAIMHMVMQDQSFGAIAASHPHILSTIGVISLTGFVVGCSGLCSGAPLNFVSHTDIGILIARKIPTVAVVTPGHLAHIIEVLPPGMRPLDTLRLIVTGGRLNHVLRDKALAKLTPHLISAYGTDECGALALGHASSFETDDTVGTVLPWVTLQVVDAQDVPLAAGQEGIIRIRSSGLLAGYADGETDRARRFEKGWFYPGDRGSMADDGVVRVIGRVDDLVSIGGEKFDLGVIDDIGRDILGQSQLGSFLSLDASGRNRINIALASSSGFDGERLAQALRAFYPTLPPVRVMSVDHVPWSLDGRVDRDRLAAAFDRAEPLPT